MIIIPLFISFIKFLYLPGLDNGHICVIILTNWLIYITTFTTVSLFADIAREYYCFNSLYVIINFYIYWTHWVDINEKIDMRLISIMNMTTD